MAYQLATGERIGKLQIDHTCLNPGCCNPLHLRTATNKQNNEHKVGAQRNNKSSGMRGVYKGYKGRWKAQLTHNGKHIYLGSFATIDEAAAAVRAKRVELFTHNDLDRRVAS